jgi:hypothetical protein
MFALISTTIESKDMVIAPTSEVFTKCDHDNSSSYLAVC